MRPPVEEWEKQAREGCNGPRKRLELITYLRELEGAIVQWAEGGPLGPRRGEATKALHVIAARIPKEE